MDRSGRGFLIGDVRRSTPSDGADWRAVGVRVGDHDPVLVSKHLCVAEAESDNVGHGDEIAYLLPHVTNATKIAAAPQGVPQSLEGGHNGQVSDVTTLLEELHAARSAVDVGEASLSHERKGDVRAQNKRMDALWAVLNSLAATPVGRSALDGLMSETPSTSLRISVANVVMRWDTPSARDALEEIVSTAGGRVSRPMTMTVALEAPWGVARDAALSLLNLERL